MRFLWQRGDNLHCSFWSFYLAILNHGPIFFFSYSGLKPRPALSTVWQEMLFWASGFSPIRIAQISPPDYLVVKMKIPTDHGRPYLARKLTIHTVWQTRSILEALSKFTCVWIAQRKLLHTEHIFIWQSRSILKGFFSSLDLYLNGSITVEMSIFFCQFHSSGKIWLVLSPFSPRQTR